MNIFCPAAAEKSMPPASGLLRLLKLGIFCVIPLLIVTGQAGGSEKASGNECVVLLHGLGRTSASMGLLEDALLAEGYTVANIDYPSREFSIEELAVDAVSRGVLRCGVQDAATIHFVTHSLGGILVRFFLTENPLDELGRVVMLSPPNRGSEVTDMLAEFGPYRFIFGPAGQQLGTSADSLVNMLGPAEYPVGIITGNEASFFDLWFAGIIPGEDDGKVSVERAKLAGMSDFLVVPYTHPFIMRKEKVALQVISFLKSGRFQH